MKTLEFTIAGGWWWCERCRKNHVECSPCPRDPNYVPADPDEVKARFEEAVLKIIQSEANIHNPESKQRVAEGIRDYINEIEIGAYTCLCVQCGKQFQSNNKREIFCGC